MRVGTWTVDDPDVARQLFAWGVDAVATNDPVSILAVRTELKARIGSG
jgi:glycerophosphoryl diester phosphodiesterase